MSQTIIIKRILLLTFTLAMSACGFHLRGSAELPFETLNVQQAGGRAMMPELKRMLSNNGVKLVPVPEQAQLQLELMSETTNKRILSLSGSGKVREYELIYMVSFRTREAGAQTWGSPQSVESRRDYTYDDNQRLAKEGEEARLYNDMRSDAAREIMRRLSVLPSARPAAQPAQ